MDDQSRSSLTEISRCGAHATAYKLHRLDIEDFDQSVEGGFVEPPEIPIDASKCDLENWERKPRFRLGLILSHGVIVDNWRRQSMESAE